MTDTHLPHVPILVTGAHRTGTTWVGKMLAASGQCAYISEPLNLHHRPGVLSTPTRCWYTYICPDNESEFLPGLRQTLSFHYNLLAEIKALRSTKDIGRMGRDSGIFLRGRLRHQRPLIKDPFAFFSAPWFTDRLGCQIVITVRHPAAFVSSLKRLNWPFDLQDLLAQPLLMRDWLEPYRQEIETIIHSPPDPIAQNSLLWRLVYQSVLAFQAKYPQFRVVRHEDLSREPLENYQALYKTLGLDFSSHTQQVILSSSSSENPKELSRRGVHSIQLDSQANLNNWKKRLSKSEIFHVRELTGEIAAAFYPALEWE